MQKNNHYHHKKPPQGLNALSSILNNGNLFRDATGMAELSQLTSQQIQAVSQNNANLTNSANLMANNAHQYNMNKQAVKDGLLHPKDAAASARENAKTQRQKDNEAYKQKVATINASDATPQKKQEMLDQALSDLVNSGVPNPNIPKKLPYPSEVAQQIMAKPAQNGSIKVKDAEGNEVESTWENSSGMVDEEEGVRDVPALVIMEYSKGHQNLFDMINICLFQFSTSPYNFSLYPFPALGAECAIGIELLTSFLPSTVKSTFKKGELKSPQKNIFEDTRIDESERLIAKYFYEMLWETPVEQHCVLRIIDKHMVPIVDSYALSMLSMLHINSIYDKIKQLNNIPIALGSAEKLVKKIVGSMLLHYIHEQFYGQTVKGHIPVEQAQIIVTGIDTNASSTYQAAHIAAIDKVASLLDIWFDPSAQSLPVAPVVVGTATVHKKTLVFEFKKKDKTTPYCTFTLVMKYQGDYNNQGILDYWEVETCTIV